MDLLIKETMNGGDSQLQAGDLVLTYGIETAMYVAMFGGNPGHSTNTRQLEKENLDWFGNSLLFPNSPLIQINSETEYVLRTVALNSSGRIDIENAIKRDLDFIKAFGKLSVSVSIVSDDFIKAELKVLLNSGVEKVKIVNFRKKIEGDFFIADFNNDFFI